MLDMTITIKDVEAARTRTSGCVRQTPLLYSPSLSSATGVRLWVKLLCLTTTGAYKEYGAANKLALCQTEALARGVIAASAGNHAQAVALGAVRLGIRATIVMPRSTPAVKIAGTKRWGATVVLEGETFDDAYAHALELARREGQLFIHPFNDPEVIAGQGVIGLEMLEDAPGLEIIVVPIGGGGLISGIAIAAKAINPKIKIIGVQSKAFSAFYARAKGLISTPSHKATLADGAAVKAPGELCLAIATDLVDDIVTVDEAAIEWAIREYAKVLTVAEGAGALSLAAVLTHPQFFRGRSCGLVLSGGNIDPAAFAQFAPNPAQRTNWIPRSFLSGSRPKRPR